MGVPDALFQALLVASTWAMFVPQALRSLTRGTAGVSSGGWAAVLAGRVVMLLYGLEVSDLAQVWSALVPGALAAFILAKSLSKKSPAERRRAALWAAAAALVAYVSTLESGAVLESVALVVAALVSAVPHVTQARSSSDLSGVSVPAWLASLASSLAWMVHGVRQELPAVVVANGIWAVASAQVVRLVLAGRSRSSER